MDRLKKYILFFILTSFYFSSFSQNRDLEYYLSTAVTNSPLLNDLRNQQLSVRIDSQLLRASTRVMVNGNSNSYYAPVIKGYGYDEAITNGAQLQALITATKNLIPKKTLGLQFSSLQLTSDSLMIASKISEQDLKKNIINQYITVWGDQLQVNFNDQLRNLLGREEVVLKRLTQKNVYKQVDYLSFLVTYQQQDLTRLQLLVQYKNDFATLNYLAGIFDTSAVPLDEPKLTVIRNFYPDSSVYFLKFRIDSLRLRNNRSLIDAGYRPHISFYADGGYESSLKEQPYKNFGTSFGVNLTIPIYDGKQKQLQYSKLDILERTRQRNKDFFQSQYYQQIAQLQQQLDAIETLLEPINKQIKYIETLIGANGKLLETGDIKMTDYVLAINNLITARNLIVQNMVSRYQVINQLNYWNR